MPSTTTTLNDLVGEIVSKQAQSAAYGFRVMRNLVHSQEVPNGAGSIVIPRFQALTPAALSQGVAPSSTPWSSDGVTLTPVERGVLVSISKSVLWADPFSDLEPYGNQMGRALAQDEDKLILANVNSLTSNVVNEQGTTANDMTLTHFLSAISALENENAPAPYFAVFHPTSWAKIRAAIDDAAAYASVGTRIVEGFGEGKTQQAGFVGSPYGVQCYMSSNVVTTPIDGSDVAYLNNIVASQECLGYAHTYDLRVDTDDNIPARAIDCMAWYAGDTDILVDEWGVRLEDKPAA